MRRKTKQILSLALAFVMLLSMVTLSHETTYAKTVYLTRAQAVEMINETLGITKYSQSDMKNVTDVKKQDSCYKTMARAINAGIISPNKDGKLSPNGKATYRYVAGMLAKVDDSTTTKMLGKRKASGKLTQKALKNYMNKIYPIEWTR